MDKKRSQKLYAISEEAIVINYINYYITSVSEVVRGVG
jgi:hypothetical protein